MSRRKNFIEQTNPLRGLTPATVVGYLEAGQRGELPMLMWLYHIIEQSDPDLLALVERRISAVCEMDWNIVSAPSAEPEDGKRNTEEALRAAYDRIENLQQAIAHLALASFRGFSICQLQDAEGNPAAPGVATRIACLPHWNFVRDGIRPVFKWNPEARQTSFDSLAGEPLDPTRDRLLIRVVERPINRIALVKFIRSNFTQKAWADYIEKVASDGVFIVGPPGVPDEKAPEYKANAESASAGGGGYLPYQSDVKFANAQRGLAPFEAHMRFLREQLVMAGTGGILTMLSEPTGIGGGATGAHANAFKTIARKEAREISEVFQRYFDKPLLQSLFPGEPVSAWFELAYREETDSAALVSQVVQLAQVFDLDPSEISEKTGLTLSKRAAPPLPPAFALNAAPRMAKTEDGKRKTEKELARANEALVSEAVEKTLGLRAGLLKEFFADLDAQPETLTEAQFLDRLEKLVDTLPEIVGDSGLADAQAIYEGVMGAGLANQIAAAITEDGKRKTEQQEGA